jgi:ABC-2 type transport system permease protein
VSAKAAVSSRRAGRDLGLFLRAVAYEFRKVTAFRTGFVVQELLRGIERPVVLLFLFHAVYKVGGRDDVGGYSYADTVHYLLLIAFFEKLVFHDRALDLSLQIFEGYVTKFLVMPMRYFVLPLARWAQFVSLQLVVVPLLWALGALCLPSWWPLPANGLAVVEAAVLILLGSYCHLLLYFILHSLAFWLDVVWSLLVMARFVTLFIAGAVLPVAMMPEGVIAGLRWLFPYWTLAAPAELFLGLQGHGDFARGVVTLCASAVVLELVRRALWRAGIRHYSGSGM